MGQMRLGCTLCRLIFFGDDVHPAVSAHVELQLMQAFLRSIDLTSSDRDRDKSKGLLQAAKPEQLLMLFTKSVTDGYFPAAQQTETLRILLSKVDYRGHPHLRNSKFLKGKGSDLPPVSYF